MYRSFTLSRRRFVQGLAGGAFCWLVEVAPQPKPREPELTAGPASAAPTFSSRSAPPAEPDRRFANGHGRQRPITAPLLYWRRVTRSP